MNNPLTPAMQALINADLDAIGAKGGITNFIEKASTWMNTATKAYIKQSFKLSYHDAESALQAWLQLKGK